MIISDIKDILNIDSLHLSEYRLFSGYQKTKYTVKKNCDILCLATCDLETVTPINSINFTWFDKLSANYNCDRSGKIISNELQINYLQHYINNFHKPKIVCFTMAVMNHTFLNKNKIFTYGKDSRRVIRYLFLKNYYSDLQYELLNNSIIELNNKTMIERMQYSINIINQFQNICHSNNIKFLWTFNATKTCNEYYKTIEDSILNNINIENYIGWVENIDFLPDSSIGQKTQQKLFDMFTSKI